MKQKNIQQGTDPRMKTFGIVAVVIIIIGALFIFSGNEDENEITGGTSILKASETRYDFGDISMADGLAKHNFVIKNEGDGILKFSNMQTSCMCTEVVLDVNGKRSPKFGMAGHSNPRGWSQSINPGESANLEVIFDPNAHGPNATGPITRVVTIETNDGGNKKTTKEFIFSANITK